MEKNNQRTLREVIAHETVHSLLRSELGILYYTLLPHGKMKNIAILLPTKVIFNE